MIINHLDNKTDKYNIESNTMAKSLTQVYWTFAEDILYSQSFPIFVIYLIFVAVTTGRTYRKFIGNLYKDAEENETFETIIKYVRIMSLNT